MESYARRGPALAALALLALTLALAALPREASPYPGPGVGYTGWTAEAPLGLANPRHVQLAAADGCLFLVADDGQDVHFYRTSDRQNLAWQHVCRLDRVARRPACDAYIAAAEGLVVVGWKEFNDARWSHVVAFSRDRGATWTKYYDGTQTTYDNYEPHLFIAGGKVHAAYVSNYPGRNEVYYKRFDYSGNLEHVVCVSDASDGVPATQPCLEASGPLSASVYYVRLSGPPNPVWQGWTTDGLAWYPNEIIPTGGLFDMSWPETAVWTDGGDRRVAVVANGRDILDGNHCVFYSRFRNGAWYERRIAIVSNGAFNSYPQLSARGSDLFLVYRQSGGTLGDEGAGRINTNSGEISSWTRIDDLFYLNMPFDQPGSIDCCSDGVRFYAAAAGTGSRAQVLTKREDVADPTVTINAPGAYQRGDFKVTAQAQDDFNRSGDWLLAPQSERYDAGILHADFYYRASGSASWKEWPGGARDHDAPWEMTFPGSSVPEGRYDFRVVVADTAYRVSESVYPGVCVDRTPPSVELKLGPPDGDNGWYLRKPDPGVVLSASDALSGVRGAYYRFDEATTWTPYTSPFPLPEGEHNIHYYALDMVGNVSPVRSFSYKADFSDPRAYLLKPEPGSYYQVTMEAEVKAEDDVSGISRLTWLVDGIPVWEGPETAVTLDLSALPDGQHALAVEARDAAGRSCRTPAVLFYKDATPPRAKIVEPTGESWVRGMVAVRAEASDNLKVAGVSFFLDGAKIGERDCEPWTIPWDTSAVRNGYHILEVEVRDAAGNLTGAESCGKVTVYVGNNISESSYFAEGCTREGFETWLCIQNPGEETAVANVNYFLGEGQGLASTRTYFLPARSRYTVYVNGEVGEGKDVSLQVTSNRPIVCERPMYFDYRGLGNHGWKGCHTALGAHFARQEWYFAEGCTREGFETWLCLLNPGGEEAVARVEYMMEKGLFHSRYYRVPPRSRSTVMVNREVGAGHDVSMRVTSSVPLVAERPVYFLYQGMWDGGHNVMGAAWPEREWYFAEGCTRTGFNQWICIMNPNPAETTARIVYLMEDGGRIERSYRLAPRSRFTVNVNNDVPRQHDVSTRVTSDLPIVVERPMYFLYASRIDEGSNAMGVHKPGTSWYLAEGCTRDGFEQWLCLMNPGEEGATALLRFMLEDASLRECRVEVPAGKRVTIKVNDIVGRGHDVSCEVASDRPLVVERPMYSLYRGAWPSGDTLSGYTFNP